MSLPGLAAADTSWLKQAARGGGLGEVDARIKEIVDGAMSEELLAELQFPEVVCLQEAYDLVEISRGGTSALSDRMYSMFADKSVAASLPSALTRGGHAIAAQVRHQLVG